MIYWILGKWLHLNWIYIRHRCKQSHGKERGKLKFINSEYWYASTAWDALGYVSCKSWMSCLELHWVATVDFSHNKKSSCLSKAGWQKLCDQRSPEGQGLLRKEGPPTYAILSQRLVLSQFARFLKCFHRAFNKSHPALGKLKTKVSLLLYGFQQKSACFSLIVEIQNCCRKIRKYALYESS